jgi:hypothetical protein
MMPYLAPLQRLLRPLPSLRERRLGKAVQRGHRIEEGLLEAAESSQYLV